MASTSYPPDYCVLQPALDHYLLPPGQECPFCRCGPIRTPENPSPAPVTLSTPPDSQYVPLVRGAVNAQLRANALARGTTVTAASAYRSQTIAKNQVTTTPATPKVPPPFLFTVKVAWAVYSDADPPTTTWKRFNEYTTVAILHNACISFDTMKDTFRQQLQAQRPPYFAVITAPKGHGHWTLASNHLSAASTNSQPNLISPWPGEFRIQDVINFTHWRGDKQQYNATLLFYPSLPDGEIDKYSRRSSSVAFGDDSIIPSGRPESRFLPMAPRTPSPTFEPFTDVDNPQSTDKRKGKGKDKDKGKGKGKGKTLHKRQISEAIPSTERDEQAVTRADTSKEETRVGLRPRKPKSRS
jgi:hypothetical protein